MLFNPMMMCEIMGAGADQTTTQPATTPNPALPPTACPCAGWQDCTTDRCKWAPIAGTRNNCEEFQQGQKSSHLICAEGNGAPLVYLDLMRAPNVLYGGKHVDPVPPMAFQGDGTTPGSIWRSAKRNACRTAGTAETSSGKASRETTMRLISRGSALCMRNAQLHVHTGTRTSAWRSSRRPRRIVMAV